MKHPMQSVPYSEGESMPYQVPTNAMHACTMDTTVDEWLAQSPQVYSHIIEMAKMRVSETTAVNWRDHVGQLGDGVHGTSTQFAMEHSPSAMDHSRLSPVFTPVDHSRMSPVFFTPTHRVLRARHDTNNTSLPSPAPSCGNGRIRVDLNKSTTEMSTPMTGVSLTDAELLSIVKAELDEAQQSNRRPPPAYVCHCCYGQGHYIKDCPKRKQQELPGVYQGSRQSVGKFKCDKCRHEWVSKKCFAKSVQKCRKCRHEMMPKKMYSMQKALEIGIISPEEAQME